MDFSVLKKGQPWQFQLFCREFTGSLQVSIGKVPLITIIDNLEGTHRNLFG